MITTATDGQLAALLYRALDAVLRDMAWLPDRTEDDARRIDDVIAFIDSYSSVTGTSDELLASVIGLLFEPDANAALGDNKKFKIPLSGFLCRKVNLPPESPLGVYDCHDNGCDRLCRAIGVLFSECGQPRGHCFPDDAGGCYCMCFIPCWTWRKLVVLLLLVLILIAVIQGAGSLVVSFFRSHPELGKKLIDVLVELWKRLFGPKPFPVPIRPTTSIAENGDVLGNAGEQELVTGINEAVQRIVAELIPIRQSGQASIVMPDSSNASETSAGASIARLCDCEIGLPSDCCNCSVSDERCGARGCDLGEFS